MQHDFAKSFQDEVPEPQHEESDRFNLSEHIGDEVAARNKYLEGVTDEDLNADYMNFGPGYYGDVMRAIWGTNWAETCAAENELSRRAGEADSEPELDSAPAA